MRLLEIGVRSFRRFAGRVVLRPDDEGLTIVSGDNEEGKSSLVAALEAALFERHNVGGAVLDAMRPWSGGDPEVAVGFRLGNRDWRIEKRFGHGAGARLFEGGRRVAVDAEAERKLLELLQFEPRQGRAEMRPEHRGLFGLFWIHQGTGFHGFEVPGALRGRLAGTLVSEIDLASGGERVGAVVAFVRERAHALLSPGRRQETGRLRELARLLDEARRKVEALETDWRAVEAKLAELERLREEARRVARRDELGEARTRLRQLEARKAELDRLALEAERAEAVAAQRTSELAELERRHEHRRQLLERIDRARRERRELGERRAGVLRRLEEEERAHEAAVQRQRGLEDSRRKVEARLEALRRAEERERLEARLGRQRADLRQLEELGARLAELERELSGAKVTPELVGELRRATTGEATARAALEAAATRLVFLPEGGRRVLREGTPVPPGDPQLVTEPAEFLLEGFGRLQVRPGAADLGERRRQWELAREAVARLLDRLAVPDLAAAEAALRQREARLAERERLRNERAVLLARHEATDERELAARTAELAKRLADMPEPDGASGESGAGVPLAQLERQAEELRSAIEEVARELARRAEAVQDMRVKLAALDAEIGQADRRVEELGRELATAREALDDAELDRRIASAREAAERASAEHVTLRRELERQDPEALAEALERQRRRIRELEAEESRRRERIRTLEAELRAVGGTDLAERLAQARGELERAERDYRALREEAEAWTLLLDRLEAAQRGRRAALTRPVVERVLPRLGRLFPDAALAIDPDGLAVDSLGREGVDEPFHSLSVGTREQLAVLVRLALAELVAEARGEPPCLLLDDALVYADVHRFEVMKGILERAARERGLQILVLTCRPRDWLGTEARFVRLEECVSPRNG